ncbi:MAG: glycosyltransferase family 39 protein [Candidatus Omnitrophica bacterium]|nr:glycosyltransferase family 39 protein [Candidatus Omnitrophota bacterium]
MFRKTGFDTHVAALAILFATLFVLIVPTMQEVVYRNKHDEGYYLKYAAYISNNGLGGFRSLARDYIDNEEHWIFPNPLRIGLISVSALWVRLLGESFYSLSHLSFIAYLLFIAISYYFCRRIFGKEKAILLALLLAFSPLNMAMSRRALSESVTVFFMALTVWLFLDMMLMNKSRSRRIFFVIIFSYSILVKETNCLLAIPFIVYMMVHKFYFRNDLKPADILCVLIYPALLAGSIYTIVFGNPFYIFRIVNITLSSAKINIFAIIYGGGPWFRYIIDFMLISPWVVILAIGYIFYLILNFNRADRGEACFLIVLLVLFSLFNLFGKNIRYVMILDLPLRLFFIMMLYKLAAIKSDKMKYALICAVVLSISLTDFLIYNDFFIEKGLYNPMSTWLLRYRDMIPWR